MTAAFQQRLNEMFDTLAPCEVWISGHRFDIEFFDATSLHEDSLGEMDFKTSTIRIWKGLNEDMKRNVLIHEVIHAQFEFAGLTDESKEEELVDRLATAQTALLRDPRNRVVVDYLIN